MIEPRTGRMKHRYRVKEGYVLVLPNGVVIEGGKGVYLEDSFYKQHAHKLDLTSALPIPEHMPYHTPPLVPSAPVKVHSVDETTPVEEKNLDEKTIENRAMTTSDAKPIVKRGISKKATKKKVVTKKKKVKKTTKRKAK